jgi:hypothetical protein
MELRVECAESEELVMRIVSVHPRGFFFVLPLTLLLSSSAWAQEAAPPPPPPLPAEEAAPAPPAPAPAEPMPAPEPAPAPAEMEPAPMLEPAVPTEPMPAPEPEPAGPDLGPISVGAWGRADILFNNGEDLDDVASSGLFELHTSGKVHEMFSITANLVATYNPDIAGTAALLDGIAQFEPHEAFNIWLGRMLVPVDRSNFSGPWFMAPWLYPGFGFADGQVVVPREGPSGRNDGVTIWGSPAGGMFKYYAGVFDLYDVMQSPLYSARVSVSLLNPEPGFYNSSTYYGKDLLGIGVGIQAKEDGSVDPTGTAAPDDFIGFNADVLFEKDLAGSGVLDLEGAVYVFNGDNEPTDAGWFGLVSYLLPNDVGIGKLQPLVRVQQAFPAADGADTSTLFDFQLGYIINAYATRLALGYRLGTAGDVDTQTIFLGAQVQK